MTVRFEERMADRRVSHDTRLLGDFTVLFCRDNHGDARRSPLASPGAELGVYRRRLPVVCDECADLLRHAEKRRAYCPLDPKPFCTNCETHCYAPDKADAMRAVMRYAGPRSLGGRHTIDSLRHLVAVRRRKAAAQRSAAAAGR